jgi:hypothetical protein
MTLPDILQSKEEVHAVIVHLARDIIIAVLYTLIEKQFKNN